MVRMNLKTMFYRTTREAEEERGLFLEVTDDVRECKTPSQFKGQRM